MPTDTLTPAQVAAENGLSDPETVVRWIRRGVKVDGRVVRLAGERLGGRWRISRAAVDDFRRACNPDAVPAVSSPAATAKRYAAARDRLARELGRST